MSAANRKRRGKKPRSPAQSTAYPGMLNCWRGDTEKTRRSHHDKNLDNAANCPRAGNHPATGCRAPCRGPYTARYRGSGGAPLLVARAAQTDGAETGEKTAGIAGALRQFKSPFRCNGRGFVVLGGACYQPAHGDGLRCAPPLMRELGPKTQTILLQKITLFFLHFFLDKTQRWVYTVIKIKEGPNEQTHSIQQSAQ